MSERVRSRFEDETSDGHDVKQALTCSICLEIFKQPVILPSCGHSFCFECIERIARDNKTEVTCPECRIKSKLGVRGVNSLPKNFSTRRIAEMLAQTSASTSRNGVMGNLQSLNSKCSHLTMQREHCSHCNSSFCGACLVAHIELLKMSASWISSQVGALTCT